MSLCVGGVFELRRGMSYLRIATDMHVGHPGLNNASTVGLGVAMSGGSTDRAMVTKTFGSAPVACVKRGDGAPGTTSGTLFNDEITAPAINQAGLLAFEGDVSGDSGGVGKGIFTCKDAVVKAIALAGDPKPGTADVFHGNIQDASLSDDGHVAFIDPDSTTGMFVGPNP